MFPLILEDDPDQIVLGIRPWYIDWLGGTTLPPPCHSLDTYWMDEECVTGTSCDNWMKTLHVLLCIFFRVLFYGRDRTRILRTVTSVWHRLGLEYNTAYQVLALSFSVTAVIQDDLGHIMSTLTLAAGKYIGVLCYFQGQFFVKNSGIG